MEVTSNLSMADIRTAVGDAAQGTPIVRVFLFGSRARGEERFDSDIDLDVEASQGFSLIDAGIFAEKVERACQRSVDVVSERFLTPSTRESIRKDRVLLYER